MAMERNAERAFCSRSTPGGMIVHSLNTPEGKEGNSE
jgi:hypothetical protein